MDSAVQLELGVSPCISSKPTEMITNPVPINTRAGTLIERR